MGASYSEPAEKASVHFPVFAESLPALTGKVVVITGTTTGLGRVVAKAVASKGATVIMLNRTSDRSEETQKYLSENFPEAKIVTIPCDLADFDSVKDAAKQVGVVAPEGIHILANNAGIMAMSNAKNKEGYDIQMSVNLLSHFILTKELLPLLEKAAEKNADVRIVNHTSEARKGSPLSEVYLDKNSGDLGGDGTKARFKRYQQSKLANAVFTYALQDKLTAHSSKVKVLLAHPGLSASNLQVTTAKAGVSAMFMKLLMTQSQSSEDGTMALLKCMCDPNACAGDFYGPTKGFGWMRGIPVKIQPEANVTDPKAKELLWKKGCEAAGGPDFFQATNK